MKRILIAICMILVSNNISSATNQISCLDLEGNGSIKRVSLPFAYYSRQEGDNLTLVHQGGYKVYDCNAANFEVAVIGTLQPCIGVAVTDGQKLVVFHKHWMNDLKDMIAILKAQFDRPAHSSILASIYTVKNQALWDRAFKSLHRGRTHESEVKRIKDALVNSFELDRKAVTERVFDMKTSPYGDRELGRYEGAELSVAVCLRDLFMGVGSERKIKFFSIDHIAEDVLRLKGTYITGRDYLGSNLAKAESVDPEAGAMLIPYDKIPFWFQRGYAERKLQEAEDACYVGYFGKSAQEIADERDHVRYDTLKFYPLP